MRVLAVGPSATELELAAERADDLLGALASLADGGVDAVVVFGDLPEGRDDAVRAIVDRAPDVPVIAVAGSETADELLRAGAADVVSEANREMLDRAVRCAVATARLRARIRGLEERLAELSKVDDPAPESG